MFETLATQLIIADPLMFLALEIQHLVEVIMARQQAPRHSLRWVVHTIGDRLIVPDRHRTGTRNIRSIIHR